jgi:hypothetical protein
LQIIFSFKIFDTKVKNIDVGHAEWRSGAVAALLAIVSVPETMVPVRCGACIED